MEQIDPQDTDVFPTEFPDDELIGKAFLWVYENREEFVQFTLEEMTNCSGFFKTWQEYCTRKSNYKTV